MGANQIAASYTAGRCPALQALALSGLYQALKGQKILA